MVQGRLAGYRPRVREIVVDGVRVFHVEGPTKTTAGLLFGVGMRDERLSAVGVTHLIEHLALSTLPKSHLDFNGSVGVDHTVFHATGRPEEVGAFLEQVCRALGDLPLDRLVQEAGVLAAEDCYGTSPTMAAAWTARFGLDGPGMCTMAGPGPLALTAEVVTEHAARWFTAGNAAVAVVGPLPPRLRLPLAPGARPERRVPLAQVGTGPQWLAGPCPGVGLLLDRPDPHEPAATVAVEVLRERLKDVARTQRGLSYSVEVEVLDVGAQDVVALALDAGEGRVPDVAGVLWAELSDLAEHGPRPDELTHVLEGLRRETDLGDDGVAESEAPRAAFAAITGHRFRSLAEIAAGYSGVSAADVARVLSSARRTALVVVPPEERMPESAVGIAERAWCRMDVPLPTTGRRYRPPALARLFVRDARQTLVVGEEALGLRDEDGDQHVIAWSDIAGLAPLDEVGEGFVVFGRHRCRIVSDPDFWGREAHEAVRSRVGEHHLVDLERARCAARREQELSSSSGVAPEQRRGRGGGGAALG